jgi:hypothetical protein
MTKRCLYLSAFVAINLFAIYAPVALCILLFPTLKISGLSEFLYFPVLFAELLFWLSGFSINGHAPPDWVFLVGILLTVALLSLLLHRLRAAWFCLPFLVFGSCLLQDIIAIQVLNALGPALGALGAD